MALNREYVLRTGYTAGTNTGLLAFGRDAIIHFEPGTVTGG